MAVMAAHRLEIQEALAKSRNKVEECRALLREMDVRGHFPSD